MSGQNGCHIICYKCILWPYFNAKFLLFLITTHNDVAYEFLSDIILSNLIFSNISVWSPGHSKKPHKLCGASGERWVF